MAKLARFCSRHPDRPAIGVCVITGRAICAECSTQYQGVNYSKEGLAEYLASQSPEEKTTGGLDLWVVALAIVSPVMAWAAFAALGATGGLVIDFIQSSDALRGGGGL
ncbi:MAG: hypothetical protein AAGH92_00275 [Planctomycetota bacterium]